MKGFHITIVLVLFAMIVVGIAEAQFNNSYICYTVSVNSSTVPVQILPQNPPAKPSRIYINERQGDPAATPLPKNVLVFPYAGNVVPTAVPSACATPSTTLTNTGCTEVTPSKPYQDQVTCDQPSCIGPMGQAWAGVLETGSTAVTVDSCIR